VSEHIGDTPYPLLFPTFSLGGAVVDVRKTLENKGNVTKRKVADFFKKVGVNEGVSPKKSTARSPDPTPRGFPHPQK
jgi:hypothetical protein